MMMTNQNLGENNSIQGQANVAHNERDKQWGKAEQVQPVWLCILFGKYFEETFENSHWRKVKQILPMWLYIISGWSFEETF